MNNVWKYRLVFEDDVVVVMPKGAQVLCVQMQGNVPTIWALCDPEAESVMRHFAFAGTGHERNLPGPGYVGTVQTETGLVFHLFDEGATDGYC